MPERFMLMKHTKNCWVVTIWSDGQLRIESRYQRRVNTVHLLDYKGFDYNPEIVPLPRYVFHMTLGVICDYIDWKVTCNENLDEFVAKRLEIA